MSCASASESVTVPFRSAKSPPAAVTSHRDPSPVTSATDSAAVVPAMAKSPAVTFATASLKVSRQVSASAFVGEPDGSWCASESSVGGVRSSGVSGSSGSFGSFGSPGLPVLSRT